MTNSTKVIIYDTEGNIILNDSVTSPFVGLQAGETFWFGSSNNKTWAKVISISYGIDTSLKYFVVEMVVEDTQKKNTKVAKHELKTIDHGNIVLGNDDDEKEWKSEDETITINIREIEYDDVENFVIIVEGKDGPEILEKDSLSIGEYVVCKSGAKSVKCTLISVEEYETAKFRITEQTTI